MQIANLKSKITSLAQHGDHNTPSLIRKIESFKSTPTIISRDLRLEGVVASSGLIEIEGHIKGTIKGNSVVLREDGIIEGNVIAESFNIRGQFNGDITAKNLSISSRAKVFGNIEYDTLSVEDGASIDGQFKHLKK